MTTFRRLALLAVALSTLASAACSTVIRPTRPSDPIAELGQVSGVRFDGEYVQLREPGLPVSNSRTWRREVENYTAKTLNDMLAADPAAPAARTVVSFDMAGRSAIQIGTWKEMTIELTTTLPGGRVVRSEPITRNIDSPLEYFALQGMTVGGSCLDVGVAIGMLLLFIGITPVDTFVLCGCISGMLIGGVLLHIGQSVGHYLVAASEENRWSNFFLEALTQHAKDVQLAVGSGVPAPRPPPPTQPMPTPAPPPPEGQPPPATGSPPPPLDPADAAPGEPTYF